MQQGVQTDATCKIQQCCVRLHSALLQRTVSFKCLPIHEDEHLEACYKRSVRVVLFGLLLIENSNFYPFILTLSVLKVASVKNSQKFEISFVENP